MGASFLYKPGFCWLLILFFSCNLTSQGAVEPPELPFPKPLASYQPPSKPGIWPIIVSRASEEPVNVFATFLFVAAIIHTFLASRFLEISHRLKNSPSGNNDAGRHFKAELFHYLGEVETIFGIWVLPLLLVLVCTKGWATANAYLSNGVSFTEPLFVVVIMAIASTRPVLKISEQVMAFFAGLGGGSALAWWWSLLTIGPLLGSIITEPAAITICALLLSQKFYDLKPDPRLAYATLGLLFVNISVGGTLTHFAAPPVLMVASTWGWDSWFMLTHIGWKSACGIVLANAVVFFWFRRELRNLQLVPVERAATQDGDLLIRSNPIPAVVTGVHLLFLGWTVFNAHNPVLFLGGFLFFLAFLMATPRYQNPLLLKPAILVGFFLAGLVVHGGLQAWWLEPILARLGDVPLLFGSAFLTAFNDNAAITYLASLVPTMTDSMKEAVVSGAVAGGGMTVIANAPNPAGQSILARHFENGISPLKLAIAALLPTAIMLGLFSFL